MKGSKALGYNFGKFIYQLQSKIKTLVSNKDPNKIVLTKLYRFI